MGSVPSKDVAEQQRKVATTTPMDMTVSESSSRGDEDETNSHNYPGSYTRAAYRAGSWYDSNPSKLNETMEHYFQQVRKDTKKTAATMNDSDTNHPGRYSRGIIVPHAGYCFSGLTAAYAYTLLLEELQKQQQQNTATNVNGNTMKHIVILHPSHYYHMKNKCLLSKASIIETPLGPLDGNDIEIRSLLHERSKQFSSQSKSTLLLDPIDKTMTKQMDEMEHAHEMQFPFLYKLLKETGTVTTVKITSMMCGSLSLSYEYKYGILLRPILCRPDVFTIISTDFCHWGTRFQYTPIPPSSISRLSFQQLRYNRQKQEEATQKRIDTITTSSEPELYEYIQQLDEEGMKMISSKNALQFHQYIQRTQNTICGKHAIGIYLQAIAKISKSKENNNSNNNNIDEDEELLASLSDEQLEKHLLKRDQEQPQNHDIDTATSNTRNDDNLCIQFLHYEQSSQVIAMHDNSVSYAAGIITSVEQ